MLVGLWVSLSDSFIAKAFYGQDQEEQQEGGHIRSWDRVGNSGKHGISQAAHSVMKAGGQSPWDQHVQNSLAASEKNSVTPIQYRISDCIKFSLDDLIIDCSYTCKMTGLGLPLGSLLPQASFYTWINLEVKWLVHSHAGKKWQHLI